MPFSVAETILTKRKKSQKAMDERLCLMGVYVIIMYFKPQTLQEQRQKDDLSFLDGPVLFITFKQFLL